jgi:ABC-type transport system involved in multi-copper enzyme maturation permease subunit
MLRSLGPVVRYELITTARRGRFYLVRVVYGLFLLLQLWSLFHTWEFHHPDGGALRDIHRFAEDAFIQFAGVQGLALLCVIPALVAGVIADEHQRKTLHYLLASRLSSAEIVLGKLGARLVHVGTFVALGLPVVSLLLLYGGLNPTNVFYVYLGTFTVVMFAAGLSILISTLARRPREAILATYGLEAFWLLVPIAIGPFAHDLAWPLGWVEPVNGCLLRINPAVVWSQATNSFYDWRINAFRPRWSIDGFESSFYWMVGLQGFFGLLWIGLAVAGLRPLRGSSWPGGKPQTGWWTRLRARGQTIGRSRAAASLARNELLAARWLRPPCGDAPMLWKEMHTRLGGGLKWMGSRPVALFLAVFLGCFLFDLVYPVVVDLARGSRYGQSRSEMNAALRFSSVALAILAMFPAGAAAATSLTGEREQDTWLSLATTLLTPGEIIRAKQFGALWSARWIGLALLVLWSAGLLLGALHPIGVLAAAMILAAVGWLVAAVGVFFSGRAKNSTRALALTCIALFIGANTWPPMLWALLFSYRDLAATQSNSAGVLGLPRAFLDYGLVAAWLMILYGTVASLLTFLTIRRLRKTWGQV